MTDSDAMSDTALVEAFLDTTLPVGDFHHPQHVRCAWLFIRRHGMPAALDAFSAALRRFANAKGATMLYHETITWAYVLLIHDRQQRAPAVDWPTFAAANADLLTWKPSVLDRLYTADTLWSDLARRTFLMPDRVPPSIHLGDDTTTT
jgi:hypothetical protein